MNILVLDDEQNITDMFKYRLDQEGYICMTASTIDEAVAKSRAMKFDLLIVDLGLSRGERGDDFAREYRKRNPWVLIFIFSGTEGAQISMGLKPDKIFTKPLDFDVLIAAIKQLSSNKKEVFVPPPGTQLSDRDANMIMMLSNKVVEHTNIVATTQSLIGENLEELAGSQERLEDKVNYIYDMLKDVDDSGILKMYKSVRWFFSQVASKLFWAVLILVGMYIIKGPMLVFFTQVLKK
jgi:DNA-binding response OmpR family regulator